MKLIERYYKTELGHSIEEYLIDTDAELASLPKAPVGSFAVSVESGKKFFINSSGEWPDPSKYVGGGSGGGGGSTGGGGDSQLDALIDGSITEITSNVTSIKDYKFKECKSLKTAYFPQATKVGQNAFDNCIVLETIHLPLVTETSHSVFTGCKSLKTANIQSLKRLNSSSFSACLRLEIIDLPSVAEIHNYVFSNCNALRTVILRNETVVSLGGVDAFRSTPFRGYNGLRGTFYVKQHLIEEYTTMATNWPALYAEGFCDFLPIEGSIYE